MNDIPAPEDIEQVEQGYIGDGKPDDDAQALPTRHVLTDADMLTIQDAVTKDGEAAGVCAVWEIILGMPLETHDGQINPYEYAISATQWEEIAGYMVRDPRVQHPSYEGIPGFMMMNQGPSSYTEDA